MGKNGIYWKTTRSREYNSIKGIYGDWLFLRWMGPPRLFRASFPEFGVLDLFGLENGNAEPMDLPKTRPAPTMILDDGEGGRSSIELRDREPTGFKSRVLSFVPKSSSSKEVLVKSMLVKLCKIFPCERSIFRFLALQYAAMVLLRSWICRLVKNGFRYLLSKDKNQ